jgi:hypothetical protein
MRDAAWILVCTVGLAGCASTPPPYGNFIQEAPAGVNRAVAEDAVRQMAALYPPANTRFDLQQPTPDLFGQLFTTSLRAKGYAVQDATSERKVPGRTKSSEGEVPAGTASAVPLRYVLDRAADLYRITLLVGDQSLTRAYLAQNGTVHPAGAWVRKE